MYGFESVNIVGAFGKTYGLACQVARALERLGLSVCRFDHRAGQGSDPIHCGSDLTIVIRGMEYPSILSRNTLEKLYSGMEKSSTRIPKNYSSILFLSLEQVS